VTPRPWPWQEENEKLKDEMAVMAMEGHLAGFGGDLSAEEWAYQQAKQQHSSYLVASVGVVGVFLGADTSNKNVRFASSACARRRWWPGTSTGFTPPGWDSAPVSGWWGVGEGLVYGMRGRGGEISRSGPYQRCSVGVISQS
jgi:hypothetical protein